MYFWSVSWSTNCPVYFSFFLVDQKKFVQFRDQTKKFWSVSDFFWSVSLLEGEQKNQRLTKKKFRDWPKFFCPVSETGQFFFCRPKKMRNRPDNWSTKRLTKSTWTPHKKIFFQNGITYNWFIGIIHYYSLIYLQISLNLNVYYH